MRAWLVLNIATVQYVYHVEVLYFRLQTKVDGGRAVPGTPSIVCHSSTHYASWSWVVLLALEYYSVACMMPGTVL